MDNAFPLELYKGEFIKITAYGLKYLPEGNYKIIYSERNIDEIMDSMEKMAGKKDKNRSGIRNSFFKLNNMIKNLIISREDIDVLFLSYNEFINDPKKNIYKIGRFLKIEGLDVEEMIGVIDYSLYRHRISN